MPARQFQPCPPFAGRTRPVPVVSGHEFGGTGFTAAHLGNSPLHGYRVLSSLPVEVGRLLRPGRTLRLRLLRRSRQGGPRTGLGDHYDAELRAVDRLVADVSAELPPGAVLVVTADHGQIDVGPRVELLGREIMEAVALHLRRGPLPLAARPARGHRRPGGDGRRALRRRPPGSWRRDQLIDEGVFGGAVATRSLAASATWP